MYPHETKLSYDPTTLNLYVHHHEMESSDHERYLEDGEHNFENGEIKLENWEYIKEYDDSVIIELSSDEDCFMLEDRNIESENEDNFHVKKEDHSFVYCKSDFKSIEFGKPLIERKRQRKNENVEKKTGSLKNISYAAYKIFNSLEDVKLSKLNEQLVDQNPEYNKINLKRRLYDVVSVLQSASLLMKKGEILIKNVDEFERLQELRFKQEKKTSMDQQIYEIGRRIQEKKQKLNMLKKEKMKRMKSASKLSNEKVMLPMACYIPEKSIEVGVNCIETMKSEKSKKIYIFKNYEDIENFDNKMKSEVSIKCEENTPDYLVKEISSTFQSTE